MSAASPGFFALNAGVVSRLALARVDLAKLRFAGEVQENLLPMVLGPCIFRPGTAYLDTALSNAAPVYIPFIYDENASAMLVITTSGVQFLVNDQIVTRPAVTTTVTNGTFSVDLSSWTDADESGAASTWAAGGYMQLLGTGENFAKRTQEVTTVETGIEHALRVVIKRGPVVIRVGSTAGGDEYVSEKSIGTGQHSLAFTPTGNFHITLSADAASPRLVDSVTVESAGDLTLDNPWSIDIGNIRYDQSGSILFVACEGYEQRRIRLYRNNLRSWGIDLYQTFDGPFDFPNNGGTTLTPSAVTGEITLTASKALFRDSGTATHIGGLWRLTHPGQTAAGALAGVDQATDHIRVTGLAPGDDGGTQRTFTIEITGTFVGTVVLERSFAEPGGWATWKTYTAILAPTTLNDELSNQIVYYRFRMSAYTSGTADVTITYANSIQKGIVRITAVASSTSATAEVISTLGKTAATTIWEEGEWSGYRGFPSAVQFHDGRLWWGFEDFVYGSVSDAFDSFDDEFEGDAGPIIRSIVTGSADPIRWFLSMQRLLAATASQEVSIRASSFDEPLTPTQFTARSFSNRGSFNLQALKVDGQGVFVQRNGKRVYLMVYVIDAQDYQSQDATRLNPDICEAGILGMAVQRQPDTRIWFWLSDGTAAVLTYEPQDEVVAWTPVTTNGRIKAIGILPGDDDDQIYFAVERSPTSGSIMAIEKLAKQSEAVPGTLCKVMDSHVVYDGVATTTLTGGSHIEGLNAVVWGDGKPYPGPFTVNGGSITLPVAVSSAVWGLGYDGKFKSAKLAYAAAAGTAVGKQKRVAKLGLLMQDVGWYGVKTGKSLTDSEMHRLPPTLGNGRPLVSTESIDDYDYNMTSFNGGWGPDERLCFKVSSPYPATFKGITLQIETSEAHTFGAQVAAGGG